MLNKSYLKTLGIALLLGFVGCADAGDFEDSGAEFEEQDDDYIGEVLPSDDLGKADAFGDFEAEYSLADGITPQRQLDYPNTLMFGGRGCRRTLARSGCAITAHAMLMDYYGSPRTVSEHNSLLRQVRGNTGCLLYWHRGLASGVSYRGRGSASMRTIRNELNNEKPVIAHVAKNSRSSCHHFVLVTGYSNNGSSRADFEILDPTTGTRRNLSAYGKVCSTRLFDGPNPN